MFLGYSIRIFVIGGVSLNFVILRVIVDVFDVLVFVFKDIVNFVCLGCVYRVKYGLERVDGKIFWDAVSEAFFYVLVLDLYGDVFDIYDLLIVRYKKLEDSIVDKVYF